MAELAHNAKVQIENSIPAIRNASVKISNMKTHTKTVSFVTSTELVFCVKMSKPAYNVTLPRGGFLFHKMANAYVSKIIFNLITLVFCVRSKDVFNVIRKMFV